MRGSTFAPGEDEDTILVVEGGGNGGSVAGSPRVPGGPFSLARDFVEGDDGEIIAAAEI